MAASPAAGAVERIGTQPQRHVGGLHRLPYHTYRVVAQGVEVCLIPRFGREGGELLAGEVCLFILRLSLIRYRFHVVIADSDKVTCGIVDIPKAIRVS